VTLSTVRATARVPDAAVVPSPSEQPPTEGGSSTGRSASRGRRGPKTAAGKARVSGNAVAHGLTSIRPILPGECSTDWQTHRTNIIDALAPVGALETALAEHVASVLWRLRRVMMYESASIDERQHLEQLSARLLPHPLDIDKIIRYEAHLRRLLYEALHELEAMQDARHGKPTPLLRVDVNNDTGTRPAAESA